MTSPRDELIGRMEVTAAAKPLPVEVPGWGTVHVRALTVAEADEAAQDAEAKDKTNAGLAKGAARVICDPEGQRIFDPASADDLAIISRQPWPLLAKVLEVSRGQMDAGKS
jgi:hypothetical protein